MQCLFDQCINNTLTQPFKTAILPSILFEAGKHKIMVLVKSSVFCYCSLYKVIFFFLNSLLLNYLQNQIPNVTYMNNGT